MSFDQIKRPIVSSAIIIGLLSMVVVIHYMLSERHRDEIDGNMQNYHNALLIGLESISAIDKVIENYHLYIEGKSDLKTFTNAISSTNKLLRAHVDKLKTIPLTPENDTVLIKMIDKAFSDIKLDYTANNFDSYIKSMHNLDADFYLLNKYFLDKKKEQFNYSISDSGAHELYSLLILAGIVLVVIYTIRKNLHQVRQIIDTHNTLEQRHRDELELKVKNRTKELGETNSKLRTSIDELIKTQDKLIESEKLASLGNLTAGIAHEINTPIGNALLASTFLQQEITNMGDTIPQPVTAVITDSTRMIIQNIERAATLIKSFKQVSADQVSDDIRRISIKNYIMNIVNSLRPMLKKGNHIIEVESDDIEEIYSYPGAISQVITNLVTNSVEHGFSEILEGHITIKISKKDNHIIIDYVDNGCGINEDIRKKIFEPFTTTRRGKGSTGLGLNISHNLVRKKLKGRISVIESTTGAHFTIAFPIPEMPTTEDMENCA